MNGVKVKDMKYGENPNQKAQYEGVENPDDPLAIVKFKIVHPTGGQFPSWNNVVSLDRALQSITHIAAGLDVNGFMERSVPFITVGTKHGNACGAGVDTKSTSALKKMIGGYRDALFGGTIITSFVIDERHAKAVAESVPLLAQIIAPKFSTKAISILTKKYGARCWLLANTELFGLNRKSLDTSTLERPVRGGKLIQENFSYILNFANKELKRYGRKPSKQRLLDLVLAWGVNCTSNSNTITIAKNGMLIANAVGQQMRSLACKLAIQIATENLHMSMVTNSVAVSDSFFPFRDGPEVLAVNGVKTILTTSGSKRDSDTIELCKDRGVTLLMIPDTVGRGFFGH